MILKLDNIFVVVKNNSIKRYCKQNNSYINISSGKYTTESLHSQVKKLLELGYKLIDY